MSRAISRQRGQMFDRACMVLFTTAAVVAMQTNGDVAFVACIVFGVALTAFIIESMWWIRRMGKEAKAEIARLNKFMEGVEAEPSAPAPTAFQQAIDDWNADLDRQASMIRIAVDPSENGHTEYGWRTWKNPDAKVDGRARNMCLIMAIGYGALTSGVGTNIAAAWLSLPVALGIGTVTGLASMLAFAYVTDLFVIVIRRQDRAAREVTFVRLQERGTK